MKPARLLPHGADSLRWIWGCFVYFMKCDEYIVEDVSGVAQATPKLGDSPEGLPGFSIQSYSCLWFYYSERIYNKASLRIRYMGRNLEETRHKSPRFLSKRTYLFPQQGAWQHMGKVVYPGISLETQDPGFLLRASHIGTIYLPDICQNSRYPEGKWIGIRHEPPCLFRIV